MAIAFKITMAASALWSVMLIATTQRGADIVEPVPVIPEFSERFPLMLAQAAMPASQPTTQPRAETELPRKVKSGHKSKLRATCRRSYFYIKGHRYWSCNRARNQN